VHYDTGRMINDDHVSAAVVLLMLNALMMQGCGRAAGGAPAVQYASTYPRVSGVPVELTP